MIATLVMFVGCSVASAARAATPGELTVLSPDKISVTSGGKLQATIAVLNAGAATSVRFRVDGDKPISVTPQTANLKADDVTRFALTFAPGNSATTTDSGQLIMTAGARPPAAVPFDLTPRTKSPDWVPWLLIGAFVAATALVILAWLSLASGQPNAGDRLGPVNWDFSQSFASNITVFSAVLGTILSAGVLPKDLSTDRVATFAGLNLLFGIAVIAGPFLYTACQRPEQVNRRGAEKEPQYQGYVWTFLVASIVTVWATAGEFFTIGELFGDIRTGGSLPEAGFIAFVALIAIGGVALIVLVWTRTRAVLCAQGDTKKKNAHKKAKRTALVAAGVTDLPTDTFKPELDTWSLL